MLRLGIAIEETWRFFSDIYEDLSQRYQTSLFKRRTLNLPAFHTRVNRYLFHSDMQTFMRENDVAFFEWASELLATATHLPKRCGIVTRLHRYEMYQWIDKINWDAVDRIILVSQAKKQEFIDHFPEQASKAEVIPVGIDLNRFHSRNRKFNGDVGILCDLIPRKRVYDLILTFYELIQCGCDLHLHIGGGAQEAFSDYYLAITDLIKKLNLQEKVTLYGNVLDSQNWYQNIDIFISNSYSEGLQVAPMEAMACGCYCLSHHWHGAEELLPDDEHLYYTNNELKSKILAYCENSESEKQRLRERMRAHIYENSNIENTKIRIREIIDEVGDSYKI
jgi:glycosyltransferase involved in cell wall biosynthesis